jgi:hypothetical protein
MAEEAGDEGAADDGKVPWADVQLRLWIRQRGSATKLRSES